MTKLKCLICGYLNELGAKKCVECQTSFDDPTVTDAEPQPQRRSTTY